MTVSFIVYWEGYKSDLIKLSSGAELIKILKTVLKVHCNVKDLSIQVFNVNGALVYEGPLNKIVIDGLEANT